MVGTSDCGESRHCFKMWCAIILAQSIFNVPNSNHQGGHDLLNSLHKNLRQFYLGAPWCPIALSS